MRGRGAGGVSGEIGMERGVVGGVGGESGERGSVRVGLG